MRTRFAPSPSGPLHLGHAYSALLGFEAAKRAGGEFLLRIEDLDQSRARPEWEALIYEDLAWLGLDWPRPVMRQSPRGAAYEAALDRLWEMGLLYPCACKRRDIAEAVSAPHHGPDGIVYPGTCRALPRPAARPSGVLRLDMKKALSFSNLFISYKEKGRIVQLSHEYMQARIGDVVLARQDMAAAYHLAVVVDDAEQGVSHVVRGADLAAATPIHVLLQHLLGLPVPEYHHHRLITDAAGKRLAKRDDARAIRLYREDGLRPEEVRALVGL